MEDYKHEDLLAFLKAQALEAGDIIMRYFENGFKVYSKPDNSKVTDADLAVCEMIQERTAASFPEIGLYSEESERKEILPGKNYFIIDELDGTAYFAARRKGFCHLAAFYTAGAGLQIALIYYPVTGQMLYATKRGGAFMEEDGKIRRIEPPVLKPFDQLRYSLSARYKRKLSRNKPLLDRMGVSEDRIIPADAFKYLMLSRGEIDVSPLLKTYVAPWDWAAPKLLLEELNYTYCYLNGEALQFGEDPPKDNRGYLLCPAPYKDRLLAEITKNL